MAYKPKPYPPIDFQRPNRGIHETRPPFGPMKECELPKLTNKESFDLIHAYRDERIKRYIECSRGDWQSMPVEVWESLLIRNGSWLAPCNAYARMRFVEIALATVDRFGLAIRDPLLWVTVVPVDFVLPMEVADTFDLRTIKATVRQAFGNVSFFGMIEAALYKEWGAAGPSRYHDHACFHVHLITWGVTKAALAEVLKPFKARCHNMFGQSPIWVRKIRGEELESKVLYMMKGQLKQYRPRALPTYDVDSLTGEIRHHTRVRKGWMRTGDHVRMSVVLRRFRLDDLLFGSGEGTSIAQIICYEAMQPFCKWAEGENHRYAMLGAELYPEPERYRRLGVVLARRQKQTFAGRLRPSR